MPQGIKATTTSNEFENRNAFVGKIVFYKDYDTVSHPVEKMMGQWAADFHDQLS